MLRMASGPNRIGGGGGRAGASAVGDGSAAGAISSSRAGSRPKTSAVAAFICPVICNWWLCWNACSAAWLSAFHTPSTGPA